MRYQRGAVLIVSLLMLIVLTLLAVSSINTGTVNLRIVGNMQAQTNAEMATHQAVEEYLSSISNFTTPTAATITVNGLDVAISEPVCRRQAPAKGYSAAWKLVPEDDEWEFDATVSDTNTGAQVGMVQGIKIRMVAGSCPL